LNALYQLNYELGDFFTFVPRWNRIGGELASSPAVTSWSPGRIDAFYLGPDSALRHIYSEG
jgi:hypothetical protein